MTLLVYWMRNVRCEHALDVIDVDVWQYRALRQHMAATAPRQSRAVDQSRSYYARRGN
jgi:hypothetical protein